MSTSSDINDILQYLDSNDSDVSKHFTDVAIEKLYSSRDSYLINALVDRYMQNKSPQILKLVTGINENHSAHLFEKLNDCLKHGCHSDVCAILSSIVRQQPSWLHKLVGTPLFLTFLKCLKNDDCIIFVMSGIVVLTMLLPCVPALIGPHLGDMLEVFIHIASFLVTKAGTIPDICLLHLHTGIYIFFHRLYTMYPNNLLSYLKSCFGAQRSVDPVFTHVIKPMFEFVKFHPGLIGETPKSETAIEKWKRLQPHDVEVECQKMSLDPLDAIKEATYSVYASPLLDCSNRNSGDISNIQNNPANASLDQKSGRSTPKQDQEIQVDLESLTIETEEATEEVEQNDSYLASRGIETLCSPSDVCGLSTPPSSRPISPSGSMYDVGTLTENRPVTPLFDGENVSEVLSVEERHSIGSKEETMSVKSIATSSPRPSHVAHLKKTRSFGSADNLSKRVFRQWTSSSGVTPPNQLKTTKDENTVKTSAPTSPQGHSDKPVQRPSFDSMHFKRDLFRQLSSEASSAPASPMLPQAPPNSFPFSLPFNLASPLVTADNSNRQSLGDVRDLSKSLPRVPCNAYHSGAKHSTPYFNLTQDNSKQSPQSEKGSSPSIQLVASLQQMFAQLVPFTAPTEAGGTSITENDLTSSQRKMKSPINLLDEFIEHGSSGHSQQLSKIPLTSQLDTDWTYYGGNSPADELKILQNQVSLLHIQLQYERHRCQLQVIRNRRLVGKIQKSGDLNFENDNLRDQVQLRDTKLRAMQYAIRSKEDENRANKAQATAEQRFHVEKLRKAELQIEELSYNLKSVSSKKEELEQKVKEQDTVIKRLNNQLFNLEQELEMIQPKVQRNIVIKEKIDLLTKELLAQNEQQGAIKARQNLFNVYATRANELEAQMMAYTTELRETASENEKLSALLETAKSRIVDLESNQLKKDSLMRDQKKQIDNMRSKHKSEIQAMDDRLKSVKKTCQSLQSYISHLYARLEDSNTTRTRHNSHVDDVARRKHSHASAPDGHHSSSSRRNSVHQQAGSTGSPKTPVRNSTSTKVKEPLRGDSTGNSGITEDSGIEGSLT